MFVSNCGFNVKLSQTWRVEDDAVVTRSSRPPPYLLVLRVALDSPEAGRAGVGGPVCRHKLPLKHNVSCHMKPHGEVGAVVPALHTVLTIDRE